MTAMAVAKATRYAASPAQQPLTSVSLDRRRHGESCLRNSKTFRFSGILRQKNGP